jgi:cytochrome c oxidase assembly protein subunit 15
MQGNSASSASRNTAVRWWLIGVAALIALMVLVGGATRLTESGLSIVEWKPVAGTLPPLTHAQWQEAFEGYKKIPQYRELNAGMTLGEFKTIFWWEWSHRLLGRFIGVAYLLPFLYFLWRGGLSAELKRRLWLIFALGGLQGAVGWWMVASGLTQRTEVSQYRLAAHLILALVIFSAIVWTVQRMKARPAVTAPARLRFFSQMLLGLTFLQIYFGALVAGLRAGRAYNTWPTIDGAFIPSAERLFFETPWWRNLFDNVLTVQFEHRMTAYLLLAVALWQAIDALRARAAGVVAGGAWVMLAGVLLQATLGILTLLGQVPIDLALSHQAVAIVVLTIAVVNVERLSPRSARRMSEELAAARAG